LYKKICQTHFTWKVLNGKACARDAIFPNIHIHREDINGTPARLVIEYGH